MRHGEALPGVPDGQRPLSPKGRAEAKAMAQRARARGVTVTAIYHSGLLRAQQTAELVAALLAPQDGVRELVGICPEDDPAIVKAELDIASRPILLVSHLPYLGRLAGLLVTGDGGGSVLEFAPATLACLSRRSGVWKLNWSISAATP
jgi:phosphohistidine phosphatase